MFDLDREIARWRHEVASTDAISAGDVDELEDHLRLTIDELLLAGATVDEAFSVAARTIGEPRSLGDEFAKVAPLRRWGARLFWLAAGLSAASLFQYLQPLIERALVGRVDGATGALVLPIAGAIVVATFALLAVRHRATSAPVAASIGALAVAALAIHRLLGPMPGRSAWTTSDAIVSLLLPALAGAALIAVGRSKRLRWIAAGIVIHELATPALWLLLMAGWLRGAGVASPLTAVLVSGVLVVGL
jgi:hypothetical protein